MKSTSKTIKTLLGGIVVLFLLFISIPQTAAQEICLPAPSGMVAWWPGDGNTDEIVGARNGSIVGSAGFAPGIVNDAFSFNGDGWVDVPDDAIWTLGTEDFTIDLWVQFDSLSGRDPFIAHDNGGYEQDKWIFWYDAGGHDKQQGVPALRFHINSPHPAPVPFAHDTVVAPWNPLLGRWYHVAVTRSGSSYALYIDGAHVATDTSTFSIPDPVVPLTIGRAEEYRLNGLVDEVEIFDRALSASEIRAIFNAGSAGKCKCAVFSSFSIKQAHIRFNRTDNKDSFDIRGTFVPGAASNGINLLEEAVTIAVGEFSATLPVGSFVQHGNKLMFVASAHGMLAQIWKRGSAYNFRVHARHVDLGGKIANLTPIRVVIGDDCGEVNVRMMGELNLVQDFQ